MMSYQVYLLVIALVAFPISLLGFHPIYIMFVGVGFALPDSDTVDEDLHRSWIFHTFLVPAILYQIVVNTSLRTIVSPLWIHFVTVGLGIHLFSDFIFPKDQTHSGAEWPVRPTIGSAPWGLLWLGISWFVQWFVYLSNAFLPWLFGF